MLMLLLAFLFALFLVAVVMWLRTFKSDPNEYLNDDYYLYPVMEIK